MQLCETELSIELLTLFTQNKVCSILILCLEIASELILHIAVNIISASDQSDLYGLFIKFIDYI